jgi:hypothetical protein
MLKLIFVSLLLVGCGRVGFKYKDSPFIEPELNVYVYEFEETYNAQVPFDVVIEDIEDPNVAGRCIISNKTYKAIIDKDFFETNKKNYWSIHQVVFHELGHCYFFLDHNNNLNNDTYPVSIMYGYVFGYTSYYKDNIDYYKNSLVDNRAMPLNSVTHNCEVHDEQTSL